jgi:hypothetical protein
MSVAEGEESRRARARLRGFGLHLAGYFGVLVVLVPVNVVMSPENPWFVWPMVGWAAPLAFHAAYAMGLFARGRG